MILESVVSCSCLLLTCGSSIYILLKHSYNQYHKLFPYFIYACSGIAMIGIRSFIVLVYKLFIKKYTFDPVVIKLEEKRNKARFNILDEFLDTLSIGCIIYSVYSHHGYCVLGACTVVSLSLYDMIRLCKLKEIPPQETEALQLSNNHPQGGTLTKPRSTHFLWVLINAQFTYSVGNNYAFVANYPYLLATWALTPEGFYQGWTVSNSINNYMMAIYVIYMTEALQQVLE